MKRRFSVNTAKNPLVWKSSANGQFLQILEQLTRKFVQIVSNGKSPHHEIRSNFSTLHGGSYIATIYLGLLFSVGLNFSITCLT